MAGHPGLPPCGRTEARPNRQSCRFVELSVRIEYGILLTSLESTNGPERVARPARLMAGHPGLPPCGRTEARPNRQSCRFVELSVRIEYGILLTSLESTNGPERVARPARLMAGHPGLPPCGRTEARPNRQSCRFVELSVRIEYGILLTSLESTNGPERVARPARFERATFGFGGR